MIFLNFFFFIPHEYEVKDDWKMFIVYGVEILPYYGTLIDCVWCWFVEEKNIDDFAIFNEAFFGSLGITSPDQQNGVVGRGKKRRAHEMAFMTPANYAQVVDSRAGASLAGRSQVIRTTVKKSENKSKASGPVRILEVVPGKVIRIENNSDAVSLVGFTSSTTLLQSVGTVFHRQVICHSFLIFFKLKKKNFTFLIDFFSSFFQFFLLIFSAVIYSSYESCFRISVRIFNNLFINKKNSIIFRKSKKIWIFKKLKKKNSKKNKKSKKKI